MDRDEELAREREEAIIRGEDTLHPIDDVIAEFERERDIWEPESMAEILNAEERNYPVKSAKQEAINALASARNLIADGEVQKKVDLALNRLCGGYSEAMAAIRDAAKRTPSPPELYLYLRGPQNESGNPQRLFIHYKWDRVRWILAGVYDEGYRGTPDELRHLSEPVASVDISASEYRSWVGMGRDLNIYYPS